MRLDSQFIQSPSGQLIVVGFIAVVATGVVAWQRNHRRPAPLPLSRTAAPAALPRVIQRPAVRFEQPAASTVVPSAVSSSISSTLSAPPKVLPLSVVTGRVSPDPSGVIQSAPFGRLIPCETVVAIESNRLATPVIGLVTEDVWENGVLIVPAGAEVHGRAALDRARERIAVEGTWTVVWRPAGRAVARELRLTGLALERRRNFGSASGADLDGSAGLRGQVIRTDDARELRLFASAFLSSATTALQDSRTSTGLLGEFSAPLATTRNASLAGTGAVLREYASQLRDAITRDGFYLRVPAGKPFYLYVTQSIGGDSPHAVTPQSFQP